MKDKEVLKTSTGSFYEQELKNTLESSYCVKIIRNSVPLCSGKPFENRLGVLDKYLSILQS